MHFPRRCLRFIPLASALALAACSSDDDMGMKMNAQTSDDAGKGAATPDAGSTRNAGDDQTPPVGAAAVEAWLESGVYENWHCEPSVHAARAPSPHGFNRICSNDALSSHATGADDFPMGAAAVKELHPSESSTTPVGYAVYSKTKTDSAGGANWYWYERVPADSPFAPDATGVVADGFGVGDTPAKNICVGCHAAAGSDAAHTPSPGGRDQVYTPVP